jgi:hypothetical protein
MFSRANNIHVFPTLCQNETESLRENSCRLYKECFVKHILSPLLSISFRINFKTENFHMVMPFSFQ